MHTQLHVFSPLYFEKVWGGRMHETFYQRQIPPHQNGPIGESWELCDRPEAVSQDAITGRDLHSLWTLHRKEIFGTRSPEAERFPLLVKIIDASEHLSLQVHPPAEATSILGGEPKTEMWYFLNCKPGSIIYAGFGEKTSREKFLQAVRSGTSETLYHKIRVKAGDAMFLPSGRVHAIGAGNLLLEVQQNSDTTYRIDDWGRLGLDCKPRELHLEKAIRCIDFDDVRPDLQKREGDILVRCPFFTVRQMTLGGSFTIPGQEETFVFIFNEKGRTEIAGHTLGTGEFALLPAHSSRREIRPLEDLASVVLISWGQQAPSA